MSSKTAVYPSKRTNLLPLYPKDMAQMWIMPWALGYLFCYCISPYATVLGWNLEAIALIFASTYTGFALYTQKNISRGLPLYCMYVLLLFATPYIVDALHTPILYLFIFVALGYISPYTIHNNPKQSIYRWISHIVGMLSIPCWTLYTDNAPPLYVYWGACFLVFIDTIYRFIQWYKDKKTSVVTNAQIVSHSTDRSRLSDKIHNHTVEIGTGLVSSISMVTIAIYLLPFLQFNITDVQFLSIYITFSMFRISRESRFLSLSSFLQKYAITQLHISIFYFSIIWVLLGFISVQNYSTITLYTVVAILILGFFIVKPSLYSRTSITNNTRSESIWYPIGSALGFYSVYILSSDVPPIYLILLLTCLYTILQYRRSKWCSITLLTLLWGILYTNRQPTFTQYPFSPFPQSATQKSMGITSVFWNKDGWFFRTKPSTEQTDTLQLSKYVTSSDDDLFIIDNTVLTYNSISNKNERYFGNIIQHCLSGMGQMTILHDTTGIINKELGTLPSWSIHIATDHTKLLQEYSVFHQDIRNAWLLSNRIIHAMHGDRLLHTQENQQAIIEVIREPWASSISSPPTLEHAKQVQQTLAPNGVAFFIIHAQKIPEYAFLPILHNIEDAFAYVQYWKAQDNIDSIMVVAQNTPFSFSQFASHWSTPNEAIDTAANALFTKMPTPSKRVIASPKNQATTPILHLAPLHDRVESAKDIWPDIPDELENTLQRKIIENQNFLRVLQETSTGNLSVLQKNDIQEDIRENLIHPHMQSAKKEILLAQQDGQTSVHWETANTYILTAQMIAPQSVEALLLLGEIGIGQGFLDVAEEKFNQALKIDANSTPAYNGLARIAGLRKQDELVEKYLLEAQRVSPSLWVTHYNLAIFYQEKSPPIAYKSLIQALELPNGDNRKTRLALVENFMIEEKWTRALIEVDRLIQLQQPSSTKDTTSYMAQLWFLRGRIHFGLELWDKAEEDFRKATLDDPNFHAARGSIGLVKIAKGDLEGAQNAFRATLHFDPNNAVAKENLHKVQMALQAEEYRQRPK